jgi:cytochrome c oxidase assembly protein subunit 15
MRSSWLNRFAVLTALAVLALIGLGGLVTSHGVGMAVPDWPNTYGYNMFFFPFSQWVGGIFYEHTHRLVASGVGLLTTILALWLYGKSARGVLRWGGFVFLALGISTWVMAPQRWRDGVVAVIVGVTALTVSNFWPRREPSPKWLRRLGLTAFFAVVLQGVLGGLRVVLFKDEIGIFHATLAQLFFALICSIALFTSRWWQETASSVPVNDLGSFSRGRRMVIAATGLILCQLIIGATMRHQHAGLAIPDFPLAYGKIWPAMDAQSVAHHNQQRLEITAVNPITAFQIGLQLLHRAIAVLIFGAVLWSSWSMGTRLGWKHPLARLGALWAGLILVQVLLGAATIWSNKAADLATAHVVVGASSLALGSILSIVLFRRFAVVQGLESSACGMNARVPVVFNARPAPAVGIE